jgi:ribosomal protein S27E
MSQSLQTLCPNCQKTVIYSAANPYCPLCGHLLSAATDQSLSTASDEQILRLLRQTAEQPDETEKIRKRWIRLAIVAVILVALVLAIVPVARILHSKVKEQHKNPR